MNNWFTIDKQHINLDQVQVFEWDNGELLFWFCGDDSIAKYPDPKKNEYHRLCSQLGINTAAVQKGLSDL